MNSAAIVGYSIQSLHSMAKQAYDLERIAPDRQDNKRGYARVVFNRRLYALLDESSGTVRY